MKFAPKPKNSHFSILKGVCLFFILFLSFQVFAEKLPLKIYSSADGLASDSVSRIYADSKGFLWFCTDEGLSRFDGYSFKNYTQEEGLPHRRIVDFLETKDGTYLLATPNGLVVFNPVGKAYRWNIIDERLEQNSSEPPLFKTYLPPDLPDLVGSKYILSLTQDGNGNIYVSARYGLYRFVKTADDWQFQRVESPRWEIDKVVYFAKLFTDSHGDVWLGTNDFIYRILKSGEVEKISEPGGNSFFEDRDGNIWIASGGHEFGIRVFSIQNGKPVLKNIYTKKDGLLRNGFSNAIAQNSDGRIFVTSDGRLFQFIPEAKENELKFRSLEMDNFANAANKDGTIWFGTVGKGVARYSSDSFYTFDEKDGLPDELIKGIFGNKNGEVFLSNGNFRVTRIKDGNPENVKIPGITGRGWIDGYYDLQSQDGEFWFSTNTGLLRFPQIADFKNLAGIQPRKIYTTTDGLFGNNVTAVFEDSRGDIWICTTTPENSLLRWEKSTERIHRYTSDDGLPITSGAVSFGEDAAGNIWIGFYFGQTIRYKDGKFRDFAKEGLIQPNFITKFLSDKQGRLWLSTANRGIFHVDEPNAETPVFTNFSMANGLSSNNALCLTKDKFGRIYVSTGRGINRLEPDNLHVKVFTQNDGLPGNMISHCYADVNGNLWFSSITSLIKFIPEIEKPSAPPPIFIDGISVNGKIQAISELGEKEIKHSEFNSEERQIQISFFAISFEAGEILRYQYKLGEQDWSEPSERRAVDFNLSPGTYNFAVRAITANGVLSRDSATFSFTIARPVWQRWWFITLAILIFGSMIFAFVRYRLGRIREVQTVLEALNKSRAERLAELQRIRTRIATDLHDDIGSSLSQISLYSELARQREREQGKAGDTLDMITNVANDLVDTMSDIVWAINPKKDHLQDLTQRMRRFGANVLTAKEIDLEFNAPISDEEIPLGANIRREVFLIFRETVNNIAKHSEATTTKIVFSMRNNQLFITFEDNGKGFDQTEKLSENGHQDWKKFRGGNGLLNMRKRAAELGGNYEIKSEIGKGTIVNLSIPILRDEG